MVDGRAPLLEMRGIRKDFFGNQVLTDVNLTLREGEVLGLVSIGDLVKETISHQAFLIDQLERYITG